MGTVELQHKTRGLHFRSRLRGLDAADHVDRLGIVGHKHDVALSSIFVQATSDAQRIFQEISRAKFAEDMWAVPEVPLIERDIDVFALERLKLFAIPAMRLGLGAHRLGDLCDMRCQAGRFLSIEMLADQVHVLGAFLHHTFAPGAGISDGHELDRRIFGPQDLRELVVFADIVGE